MIRDGTRGVRADQDRHRRRSLFRGAVGPQSRRPGHHRPVQQRARYGRRRSRSRFSRRHRPRALAPVNKYLDAAGIALSAIWASKLRSLMTVLGNIVAVTSIIAVVSLIQGLNASVSRRSSTRRAPIRSSSSSSASSAATRNGCACSRIPASRRQDADAVKRYSPLVSAVMLSSQARARVTYRDASIDGIQITGVTPEYVNFSNYDAERGRLISPTEVDVDRPVVGAWRAARRTAVRPGHRSARQDHPDPGRALSASSASAQSAARVLGQTQDEFAVIPLGQFQQMFGARRQLHDVGQAARLRRRSRPAIDDTTLALRIARRLKPSQPDNFAIFNSDTVLGIYRSATSGIFAVLDRRRGAVARRRRHRHHEHHADGRHRAHARDRTAQGAGRAGGPTS